MESLRARRTSEVLPEEPIPAKPEKHKSRNKKITVDGYSTRSPIKNTSILSLPPTVTRDRNLPSPESLVLTSENKSRRREVITNEIVGQLNSSKLLSSPDRRNEDSVHQKPPMRLAPLDLPAGMKEAQLQKLTEMKDEVYLDRMKHPHHVGPSIKTLNKRSLKRDPLHKLPKLKDDIIPAKHKIVLNDSSQSMYELTGRPQGGLSSFSMLRIHSGHVHGSVPKTLCSNPMDGENVSVRGRFKHGNRNQSVGQS